VYALVALRRNSVVSSIGRQNHCRILQELYQVGIKHIHSDAFRKNSIVSSRKVRITEDSRHSARRALSRC
jgi:hypothetical protein